MNMMQVYSIYDAKAEVFARPFFSVNEKTAIRGFVSICTDAEHPVGAHPHDYSLWYLGEFNDVSGELVGRSPSEVLSGREALMQARQIDRRAVAQLDEEIAQNA